VGSYLFQRVLQEGKDSRFDKIKTSPSRFGVAFMVQAMWVSLCLMPVMAVNAIPPAAFGTGLKVTDMLGLGLYVGGLTFEVMADRQKSKWMKEKREKQHDEEFLTRGLWSKSRHPNYFGESTLWTGIATASAGVLLSRPVQGALALSPMAAVSLCAVSPAFVTFLLLKVSGIPLSEEKYDKKFGDRKDYQEWKTNTPKFFPKLF
jgi:steroid 5-alpha reductase family enzyme